MQVFLAFTTGHHIMKKVFVNSVGYCSNKSKTVINFRAKKVKVSVYNG